MRLNIHPREVKAGDVFRPDYGYTGWRALEDASCDGDLTEIKVAYIPDGGHGAREWYTDSAPLLPIERA